MSGGLAQAVWARHLVEPEIDGCLGHATVLIGVVVRKEDETWWLPLPLQPSVGH